jgi:hypothetical protein
MRASSVVASNFPAFTSFESSALERPDVRLAIHQRFHDTLTHIVSDHLEARLGEFQRQRKSDVSQSDHADARRPVLDLRKQLIF